jgi:Ca2+-binding EF-hand superfamily protein
MGGAALPGGPLMRILDTNQDGVIDADEIAGATAVLWAMDLNKDGQLTPDELMASRGGRAGVQDLPVGAGPRGRGPGGPAMQPIFAALDANHDGVIDAAEIAKAPAALAALDRNHDGVLTPDELMGPPGEPIIMALDLNKDGVISASEIANASKSLLALDKNGDGQLTRDEFSGARGGRAGMQPPPAGDVPRGRGPGGPMQEPIVMALDADHDGVIGANEIANAPAALLTLDKNSDGKLTPDELRRF